MADVSDPMIALALLSVAQISAQADLDDRKLVAMGHRAYVSQFSRAEDRGSAERKFAIALGKENAAQIARHPHRQEMEQLQVLIFNATKGACRVGDYAHESKEVGQLLNRKADSLANLTIAGLLSDDARPLERISQTRVWETFHRAGNFHKTNLDRIKSYARNSGGFSSIQLDISFRSIGATVDRLLKRVAPLSDSKRAHAIYLCDRLFGLTMGKDPLPY